MLDENDNVPELSMPTGCVQITEYHELNEVIASIYGKDADDPNSVNGKLHFQISQGNFNGKQICKRHIITLTNIFKISRSIRVETNRCMDR